MFEPGWLKRRAEIVERQVQNYNRWAKPRRRRIVRIRARWKYRLWNIRK